MLIPWIFVLFGGNTSIMGEGPTDTIKQGRNVERGNSARTQDFIQV
jgi:hypothetical protein